MAFLSHGEAVLHFLHRLARRFQAWRPAFFVVAGLFIAVAVFALFTDNQASPAPLLQLGLSGTLWTLMLLATIELFQTLPTRPERHHGFFLRLKLRLVWLFYLLLALMIVASSIILLSMSIRLLRV